MTPEQDAKIAKFSEIELLARLLWGEARNQPLHGILAIAHVVLNRLKDDKKRHGYTWHGVILKKWQFSCFNDNDPNLNKLLKDNPGEHFEACSTIAELCYKNFTIDPTKGATHYFNPKVVIPKWIENTDKVIFCCEIGDHKFYKEL